MKREELNLVIHDNTTHWCRHFDFVVCNGHGIVGLQINNDDPEIGFVHGLHVTPDYRRQGIAGHLMDIAEEKAKEIGLPRVGLVAALIDFVVAFYEKRGYIRDGDAVMEGIPMQKPIHHEKGTN